VQRAHEVRGSAAVAAADLQYLFAVEIRLDRHEMVELDAGRVRLIGRRQRKTRRRILLVAVVETSEVFRIESAGERGGPSPCL
jgi:hypothetical protein